jgi:ABC-2 type transport system permease protein
MFRYFDLYGHLLRQNLKIMLEYRASFFIGAFSTILFQGAGLLTLWVVMRQVPNLNGWTLEELLLIYGLMVLARSLDHMFTNNIWHTGGYIRHGGFDRFLVRPIDPLFHLLANGFTQEGVGNFVVGLVLVVSAGRPLGIYNSAFDIVYLVVSVLSGAVIFFSLNLITSVSAFWIIDSIPISSAVYENHNFAYYPLTIYPRVFTFALTWIIPYGFVAFYPASYLLGRDPGPLLLFGPVVAMLLLVIGYRLWNVGLRHYTGTGS